MPEAESREGAGALVEVTSPRTLSVSMSVSWFYFSIGKPANRQT